ncbi:hypothetical protein [Lysobacter capsici]|uniref:hypothetical protein n=1 Tax=Lysobacter capsici TaxID=435897 RepID=UPI001C002021|nr:hypothetical protein [Lysobacter capsici]QWF16562.1 hypothetical protein KME82_22885 [Lysobacter capsici]
MRIAFDIDGTLTPLGNGQFRSSPLPFPMRLLFREPLRDGTVALMRELQADGHDLWIYTSSLRSERYLYLWLWCAGIRLGGVVNGTTHANALRGRSISPSKFPPAFGIDLLVDDSAGVEVEGDRHGFRVVVIDPGDPHWASKVKAACQVSPERSFQPKLSRGSF